MEYNLLIEENKIQAEVEDKGDNRFNMTLENETLDIGYTLVSDNLINMEINGKRVNAFVVDAPDGKTIMIGGLSCLVRDADTMGQKRAGRKGPVNQPDTVTPPIPAVVVRIMVSPGDSVEKGQGVIVVSAMKMETTLNAPYDGEVTGINVAEGDKVSPGQILVDIEKQRLEGDES